MFKIKDVPVQERPRERLQNFGPASLSLSELIQIILEKGNKQNSVLDISRNILERFSDLEKLDEANLEELKRVSGLGDASAAKIKAALELGKRFYSFSVNCKSDSILSSAHAFKMALTYLKGKKKEFLLLFNLTVRNQLIGNPEVISVGILDASLIHPREIFASAIKSCAGRIILAHNHPSGASDPSEDDLAVTQQVYRAGEVVGIELIDHLVLAKSGFSSIRSLHPELFS